MSKQTSKIKPKIVSKSDIKLGAPTHTSKWIQSKSGGLMAAIRVDGRVVFPDSRGPQPKNNGKDWAFEIVGENPKQTVYFARIIVPASADAQIKIVIDEKSGKMICIGRRPLVARFRSSKPGKMQLAEFRQGRAKDVFICEGGAYSGGSPDFDEDKDEDEEFSTFDEEMTSIYDWLRSRPVNCHSCGFEDCRCDGTSSDWAPARTTLNVLA